eukprot:COSAG05_NODE_227_length_13407_cov_32.277953_2_plen_142_part_00
MRLSEVLHASKMVNAACGRQAFGRRAFGRARRACGRRVGECGRQAARKRLWWAACVWRGQAVGSGRVGSGRVAGDRRCVSGCSAVRRRATGGAERLLGRAEKGGRRRVSGCGGRLVCGEARRSGRVAGCSRRVATLLLLGL